MKAPTRFKDEQSSGIAGHLMAAGCAESPSSDALERAAQRLGLPAGLLVTAAVTTTTSAASAAGASTTVGGAVALLTAAKAAVLGIGLGASLAIGAHWVESSSGNPVSQPAKNPTVTPAARHKASIVPNAEAPSVSSSSASPSVEPDPAVVSSRSASVPTVALRAATPAAEGRTATVAANDVPPNEPTRRTDLPPPPVPGVENASQGPAAAPISTASAAQPLTDPRLAREITSLDRARTFANRGAAAAALRELDDFSRAYGYVAMRREALLVRLDVFLALGQRAAAAQVARELLALGVPAAQQSRLRELAGQSRSR